MQTELMSVKLGLLYISTFTVFLCLLFLDVVWAIWRIWKHAREEHVRKEILQIDVIFEPP